MDERKYTAFGNRLSKVLQHRRKKAAQQGVSCYRLYDLDMPEFPFIIDIYDKHLYVAEYQRQHTLSPEQHAQWLATSCQTISNTLATPPERLHLKRREVIVERQQQYQRNAHTNARFAVPEHGLQFWVNLDDYLDTGLFLDHRPTRQRVRELSRGKRVLNLFAYTGSFSVYAAAGGASEVTTVDMSNTYIEWAQDNFTLNRLPLVPQCFIAADVLAWLPAQARAQYDLIVCDPPTFSNSKRMRSAFDVQRDHPALINQCLRLLAPEGVLFFSTNQRRFKLYDEHLHTPRIVDLTRQTTGFDFEGKLERRCFALRPAAQTSQTASEG
ncbi:MAG: class I SAM-dependent methyltransferase [Pseudomonadales bacterium]|jgi:23S rRNA (cytosine1962-C5)-methyltransferase|nr:class I SAM-dependent methyltransferase [Pseudomonadales bacterium]